MSKDDAQDLYDSFYLIESEPPIFVGLSKEQTKKSCVLAIDIIEIHLAKHGVIRKEYYEDFRNEIQKL